LNFRLADSLWTEIWSLATRISVCWPVLVALLILIPGAMLHVIHVPGMPILSTPWRRRRDSAKAEEPFDFDREMDRSQHLIENAFC
jgi:hypothetical protein